MQPEILERRNVYDGYLAIDRLRVRLADGAIVGREVERHGDAAAVLPYDAERRCALIVRLFRAPVFLASGEAEIDEACAGMIADEDDETAARREAQEELGVALGSLELVARIWPSPGVSSERQTLFLARYGAQDRVSAGGGNPSEHEGIQVIERALPELGRDVDAGRIADGKLVTLIFALRLREPGLFV
jgi:nudix-type nucleoside diphosphatase (YffH/AdpP family)